jgi:hypothetical protein
LTSQHLAALTLSLPLTTCSAEPVISEALQYTPDFQLLSKIWIFDPFCVSGLSPYIAAAEAAVVIS